MQLARTLSAFEPVRNVVRPQRGWLRAIREALGMSADQVARHLHIGRTRILDFEKAEAEDRITLGSLKKVAEAMGCKLVYAIVPESGTILQLAEKRARDEASKRVTAVEHSMALENQAEGNLDEVIEEETKRILGTS